MSTNGNNETRADRDSKTTGDQQHSENGEATRGYGRGRRSGRSRRGNRGRGAGQGRRQGGRFNSRSERENENCICTACGYSVKHTLGEPCYEKKCPKCKNSLVRE